jgi:hypothetical protein
MEVEWKSRAEKEARREGEKEDEEE